MAGCDTTIAPPLLAQLPEDARLLSDCEFIAGDLLEVRASGDGLCVAVLDCLLYRASQLIAVPEEHEEELRTLIGKRTGITRIDGMYYIRDATGVCL